MYQTIVKSIVVLMLLFAGVATAGQGIWQDASSLQAQAKSPGEKIHYYSTDYAALHITLNLAPHESTGDWSHQIQLPMPDGSLELFSIVESPIMEPALAAQYPELKSFKVYGIDDPTASGRAGITPQGFHAMLRTARGRLLIDSDNAGGIYQSRFRTGQPREKFSCGVHLTGSRLVDQSQFLRKSANRLPGNLLTYRLAVAATEEYVSAVYNALNPDLPVIQAKDAIWTVINQVNMIYESDLGIRLVLVANDGRLIENGSNVSFTNDDETALLQENQNWIDSQSINTGFDYDIGHVFSTAPGGLAFLGSACNDLHKAKGTSGQPNPTGPSFYIDYVAHEIGHQFNAEHSFNGTTSSCAFGRNGDSALEPGSGSTIMAYAGICQQENLQLFSDATFHAGSIAQIDSFTNSTAGSCFNTLAIGNNDPVVTLITGNKTIPANTPFVLDGTASDSDIMDSLTYQWDQMDAGCPTDSSSFGTDNGSNALFRSYIPRSDSWRNFPALGTQLQAGYDKAEVLPCQNRDLDFRLTARDGNSGQDTEDVRVSVDNSAGPFKITSVNIIPPITQITVGEEFEVNWEVANTNLPPISCASVDFELINFSSGYLRYYVQTLNAVSNDNDGSDLVTLGSPVSDSYPLSRVRVKCSDNIFYDLSDTDLTVATKTTSSPAIDFATYFPANMFITGSVAPVCGPVVDCTPTVTADSGGKSGGSGAIGYLWLLIMTGLVGLVKLYRRYGLQ